MKVLVAVNEFKGSLSSAEIGKIISNKLNITIRILLHILK